MRERWQGVEVWRAPIWVPRTPNGVTRILHLLTFAITSFPLMLRQIVWAPDVVLTVAPAFLCAPTAWMTARLCGAQAWLHIQDFEVDIAFRMNLLRGSLLRRVVLRMEQLVLRRFDVVSSISVRMTERLIMKGVEHKRIRYFPNWVDVSNVRPKAGSRASREKLGIAPNAIVALFSGSLGGKQGLMVIPDAARLLQKRSDIFFVICGVGIMKSELEAASSDLPNVRMIPLQPIDQLGDLLCMADIHLLPQNSGAADLVLPSKLSGMLASGRPVIATCEVGTDLHCIVSQCGIAVPPMDEEALAKAICQLADQVDMRLQLGRRARAYAEDYFERDAILARVFGPVEGGKTELSDDAMARLPRPNV